MQKILHILLYLLFFSIPLIHGQVLRNLGIDMGLNLAGNFEFTKSQFFIFLSGIILVIYSIQALLQKKELVFPKILLGVGAVLGISTIFSISSYTAFFGLSTKGHGTVMFFSLLGLYFVLIQQDKDLMKKLFFASVIGALIASLLAIKEYYLPSFDYGDLENRALATFGHPNYLVGYLLLLVPFLINKSRKHKLLYLVLIPIIFTIFLTKSAWGILIFLLYIFYILVQKNKSKKIFLGLGFIIGFLGLTYLIYNFGFHTKLHSFISRLYIWQSTISIIIDQPNILLFGSGADTLLAFFEKYKVPELYAFENFGFTADRPHNLFLNILFHFGIGGIFLLGYFKFLLVKKYKNNYLYHALIIVLLFTFFNFLSVASYVVLILIFSCVTIQKTVKYTAIIPLICILGGILSIYSSTQYYTSELLARAGEHEKAIETFPYNYKNYSYVGDTENSLKYAGYFTKNFFISQISSDNIRFVCDKYTKSYNSAEAYFYCGNYAWNIGEQELAQAYYVRGLAKIPDLWDNTSKYHTHLLISNSIDGKRFFSDKYWNITEVLQRVGYKNNFKIQP